MMFSTCQADGTKIHAVVNHQDGEFVTVCGWKCRDVGFTFRNKAPEHVTCAKCRDKIGVSSNGKA